MADTPAPGLDAVFDVGEDVDWQPIAPQARLVWGVVGSIVVVVLFGPIVVIAAVAAPIAGIAAGIALVAALAAVWWLVDRRYRAWAYALRDQDLVLRRGVLIRRLTIVPFGRMQFIDIAQGPLDRLWGLAAVQLHTAAAATDAKIPMLALDKARSLRDQLAALGEVRDSGI